MNNYPVQFRWVWKSISGYIIVLLIIVLLNLSGNEGKDDVANLTIYFIIALFIFIKTVLQRNAFKYEIGESFISFKQGIFSRRERHIPYGVIQNLIIKQDLFDRIFKLASLRLENASQGGGKVVKVNKYSQRRKSETVGVDGGKVLIPGLDMNEAEELKELILQRMRENPIDDNQSGL